MSKILLIDDCIDMLDLNRMLLETHGYQVYVADSGKEAFRLLREIETPDLILLDFHMPEMNGPEFLVNLDRDCPEVVKRIPIVMMTALDSLPDFVHAQYLSKSLEPDEFLTAVHELLPAAAQRGGSTIQLSCV